MLLLACQNNSEAADAGATDAGVDAAARLEREIEHLLAQDTSPFQGELTPTQRGEYLALHVANCAECHTPRLNIGRLDTERMMAGVENILDLDPEDPARGAIHAKNLTPDPETGLGDWSDDEIKAAFLDGVARDGGVLHPIMPYFVYHNMRDDDADAIVAYLRSLDPIVHEVPEREPLDHPLEEPAAPIPPAAIPEPQLDASHPAYESAQRGKYLAGEIGMCMFCHTEEAEPGEPHPIRVDRLFMGRRKFYPAHFNEELTHADQELDLATAPQIESKNLTPHETGLHDWDPVAVRFAMKSGQDIRGASLCAPMPAGGNGAFAKLTERDAIDIGQYLMHLEPRDSGPIADCCSACHDDSSDLTF